MEFLNLIKAGKHTEIVRHLKSGKKLTAYQQLALVERGNHEEIMCFIAYDSFDAHIFKDFIKRGKLNEMRFYLASNRVIYSGDEALVVELGRGVLNEFADYLIRHEEMYLTSTFAGYINRLEYAQALLIKSADHCVIRRYIVRRPLQPFALKLLRTKGQPEDNLVYDLTWNVL